MRKFTICFFLAFALLITQFIILEFFVVQPKSTYAAGSHFFIDTSGSNLYVSSSSPKLLHNTIAQNFGGDGDRIYLEDQFSVNNTSAFTIYFPIIINRRLPPSKIYWINWVGDGPGEILQANLDGSGIKKIISGLNSVVGIAVDTKGSKIYWGDYYLGDYWVKGKIQRANLDGSGVEDLVTTDLCIPRDIALDTGAGKMYWVDSCMGKVQRANLDGSGVEDLATGVVQPISIALDIGAGKMYWTVDIRGKIQRANLNGSEIEDLIIGIEDVNYPAGIAVDEDGDKIYWVDYGVDQVRRANLDGSEIEDLVVTGLSSPAYIALDVSKGKMYWTDPKIKKLQRANLDGSKVEDLVIGNRPGGIDLGF